MSRKLVSVGMAVIAALIVIVTLLLP